jgi:hypothetical protein
MSEGPVGSTGLRGRCFSCCYTPHHHHHPPPTNNNLGRAFIYVPHDLVLPFFIGFLFRFQSAIFSLYSLYVFYCWSCCPLTPPPSSISFLTTANGSPLQPQFLRLSNFTDICEGLLYQAQRFTVFNIFITNIYIYIFVKLL